MLLRSVVHRWLRQQVRQRVEEELSGAKQQSAPSGEQGDQVDPDSANAPAAL